MVLRFALPRLPGGRGRTVAAGLLALVGAVLLAAPIWSWLRGAGDRMTLPGRSPRLVRATVAFAWPEYRASRTVDDPARLRALGRALAAAARTPGRMSPHSPYWRLTLAYSNGRKATLLVSRKLDVYLPDKGIHLAEAGLHAFLKEQTEALRRDFFGEPMPWPEVDRLWPWDERVVVRDLETGLTFVADRYGGNRHADVQPATPGDTRIMKAIYGGEWSWLRRAVVVEVKGRRVAASMNGMPHGDGTILDNDFRGHSCIHFAGSTTHGSGRADPGHRLMILKASDRLVETLDAAPPAEVALLALAAIYQQDKAGLRYAVDRLEQPLLQELFARVDHLDIIGARTVESDEGKVLVEAEVVVYAKPDPDRGYRKTLRLSLMRLPSTPGWKLRFTDLRDLLVPPEEAKPRQLVRHDGC